LVQCAAQSIGSGFVVNPDGVIVTNYHVIRGANALQIKMKDGEIYDRVDVVDHDERRDLAVIKSRAFKKLPTLTLASEQPEPGEEAVAIGNPQGLEHTVSVGVVSAYRQAEGYRLMQISVPISPGSDGANASSSARARRSPFRWRRGTRPSVRPRRTHARNRCPPAVSR